MKEAAGAMNVPGGMTTGINILAAVVWRTCLLLLWEHQPVA